MAFFFFSHTNCIPLFPLFFSSAVSAIIYFFFSFFPCSLPKRFVFSCSKPLNYSSYLEQPLLFCCCRGATVDKALRFFFFFIIVITTLGRNLLFALICFFFSLSISVFDAILVSIKKKRQTSDFIDASFFSFTL